MDKALLILMIVVQLTAQELTYRLSRDVLPQHYSLKLHPDMNENTFEGEVTITLYSNRDKDKFILHSLDLNVTHALVDQLPAVVKEEGMERISIKFTDGDYFQPGEHLIHLKYNGKLHEQFGLRKASYQFNSHKGFLVVNEFEPTHARRAFPCFDEPAFKARFNIRLVAPNGTYIAISNMPEIARYPTSNGIIFDFATSVKMSTYLVSLAITDYPYYEEVLELNNKSIPIRVYTYNASKENNHYAIEGAKIAIRFYTEYTGLEYPLPKLDMIEYNKGKISATETWGLIQFKEGLLTTNLNIYDAWQCYLVIFHELGHFWFGNLVTNDWWNDLWLQEGFATFMSYKIMAKRENSDQPFGIKLTEVVETGDSEETSQVVSYLKSADYIERRFDNIVYYKGAFLLKALEVLVGEKAFQQAIRNFLKKHAFQTATSNNLISEFESQLPNMNIRSFLESYLYQPGYPVVNIEDSSDSYVLEQVQKDGLSYKWTLPISYRYGNNSTGLLWFDSDMETVQLKKSEDYNWILFYTEKNPGIYVVNYTETMWMDLINNFKEIPVAEVRHLGESIGVLYQLKYINCDIVLKLVEKIGKNDLLDSVFKVTMNVARNIACFEPEYKILVEYLNQRFDTIDFLLKHFNATCEDNKRNKINETNDFAHYCSQWISKNLAETPINAV